MRRNVGFEEWGWFFGVDGVFDVCNGGQVALLVEKFFYHLECLSIIRTLQLSFLVPNGTTTD